MTVPMEYRLASQKFEAFLGEAAEEAGLTTRNQAYTMVQGVLLAFRRRLTLEEGIIFAQVLPSMLRALFISDWDPHELRTQGWERTVLTREVQQLRRYHNLSPDTAIRDVAVVLRRHVDEAAFERCLAHLPPPARDFWSPTAI
ncbi:hypothetical protein ATN84_10620 [Paramesorhizobium deserti]|uniref:DUF2267 domain-containing protein n=1 Tax=Paramesorhizobium deserti TaxID=1494590 RepID=A0A135HTJ4_9HYPH|nr:DUF2267 domain-containing protein [Paramesorhizobium deserti]KXF76516.1 hypothetical protein ATN84_10620 [Paramesorhizobium deserti]